MLSTRSSAECLLVRAQREPLVGPHEFCWRVENWFRLLVGSGIRVWGGQRKRYYSKGPRKDTEKRVCVASVNPNHNPFTQMLKGVTGLTCCV